MNDTDKRALLAEIMELVAPPRVRPGDITLKDYQRAAACSASSARRLLNEAVVRGLLETEKVLLKGRWTWVWRKAQQQDSALLSESTLAED